MNKYNVQYSREGEWIPFQLLSPSIYEALDWVHGNVQKRGVSISIVDESLIQEEKTFGEWSQQRIIQRAKARAYRSHLINYKG